MKGQLKWAPNYHIRKKVRTLCEKYDCDIDTLDEHCHLYPATRKQIVMMVEEEK